MSAREKFLSKLSVHVSRVLDESGLNELTVKKRRERYIYQEYAESVFLPLFNGYLNYIFGTQTEGTTIPGLDSDIDILCCHLQYKVIQDLVEWTDGPTNLLMLRENTAPGYCRLQLLKRDRPEPEEILPNHNYTYDESNRVILKNSVLDERETVNLKRDKNGPALTFHPPSQVDHDVIYALMCNSRLEATEKWAERERPCSWPNESTIHQAVNGLLFLVPVGHKLSRTKSLEWRISTSLAERCLMFSLNIVQIKTYVILKLLIKTFVTPTKFAGKSITSYHCKTALLYCIEDTDANFWREENLHQCVGRCLQMLLTWVTADFCPHFILEEANLFAGKVTPENKLALEQLLRRMIIDTVQLLLCVPTDGINSKLKMKLDTEPSSSPILDSIVTKQLLGYIELQLQSTGRLTINIVFSTKCKDHVPYFVLKAAEVALFKFLTTFTEPLKKEAFFESFQLLASLSTSLFASTLLGQNKKMPENVPNLVDVTNRSDIASLLKEASIFYCSGRFDKVELLCERIGDQLKAKTLYPICDCFRHPDMQTGLLYLTIYNMRHDIRYAHCVMFTQYEIHCVPQALRYELFKDVGNDVHQRPDFSNWMDFAVVDSLPFLYYLQYMTYKELGKEELQTQSLHRLQQCFRKETYTLFHRETAFNILGQCLEMEKQPVAAMQCYRTSLDIRPRNNAANWLVPLLLYRYSQACNKNILKHARRV